MMVKDLAWLAGLLEGEGTFGLGNERYPRVDLAMTDEDVVRKAQSIVGFGTIQGPYDRSKEARFGSKPMFHWYVCTSSEAASLMMTLYPMLGVRRQERVREILEVWRNHKIEKPTHCRRGHERISENGRINSNGWWYKEQLLNEQFQRGTTEDGEGAAE